MGDWFFQINDKFYKVYMYSWAGAYNGISRDFCELYTDKELQKEFSHYSKGTFIQEVKSTNKNEYPINGIKEDYWYEFFK